MKKTVLILAGTALLAAAAGVIASNEPANGDVGAKQANAPAAAPAAGAPTGATAQPADAGGAVKPDLYTVQGDKVDAKTLAGWKTWRALACERCHGAEQEGLVGPALRESLKTMNKEDFHTTIMNGRIEKGMPPFNTSKMVQDNWENLYAYLKGRADGKIPPGRLQALEQ